MLKGKHIIVGVTGSIAAYKAAALVRLLVKEGADREYGARPLRRAVSALVEDPAAEETTAWAAASPYWGDPFRSNSVYRRLVATGDIDSSSFDFDGPFMVSGQVRRGEPLRFAYEISGETLSFEVPLPWEVDVE